MKDIELLLRQFISNVLNENEQKAEEIWDKELIEIFRSNYDKIRTFLKEFVFLGIKKEYKIQENSWIVFARYEKLECNVENLDNQTREVGKEVYMPYAVLKQNNKFYLSYSYSILGDLFKSNKLIINQYSSCIVYSSYKLDYDSSITIKALDTFINKLKIRFQFKMDHVSLYWLPSTKLPFITESAFLEPKSNNIYVFRSKLKIECLKHEAVHALFWSEHKVWPKAVLREGVAGAFGAETVYIESLHRNRTPFVFNHLFVEDYFWNGSDLPLILSGLFVRYLLQELGEEKFLKLYSSSHNQLLKDICKCNYCSESKLVESFIDWLSTLYKNEDIFPISIKIRST